MLSGETPAGKGGAPGTRDVARGGAAAGQTRSPAPSPPQGTRKPDRKLNPPGPAPYTQTEKFQTKKKTKQVPARSSPNIQDAIKYRELEWEKIIEGATTEMTRMLGLSDKGFKAATVKMLR